MLLQEPLAWSEAMNELNEEKAIWTVHHRRDICAVHESDPELVEAEAFLKGLEAGRAEALPLVEELREAAKILLEETLEYAASNDTAWTDVGKEILANAEAAILKAEAYRQLASERQRTECNGLPGSGQRSSQ